jgi:hypothetical protein
MTACGGRKRTQPKSVLWLKPRSALVHQVPRYPVNPGDVAPHHICKQLKAATKR